jgi:thimet oligopeptidase
VNRWDAGYLTRLVRLQKYDVDSAVVRTYFTYDRTRDGLFKVVQDLYGVQIRPWKTPVWHESVGAYEILDGGKVIGRFYLDMHPREGKFGHAAAFPVRIGQKGRVVPISALICNFPAEGPMDHLDVETFFHEFGHLLHWIFAGQQELALQNFGQVEWDFVEAPSQMLEEWVWDYDTLRTFAVNDRGETIPRELVAKMVAGRGFGEPGQWRGQATYAAISLNYYNRSPEGLDLTEVWKANYEKYGNYAYTPDTHPYASFGHLDGYSAIYYTYPWSKAIALDLFSQFKANGMRDRATAARYRKEVLAPGGARPAEENIRAFLGRPLSLEPLERKLQGTR